MIISEQEFQIEFYRKLYLLESKPDYVVGPARSGAIAAVYASHYLGVPFVPYKSKIDGKIPLIVDTACQSGRTLRKASRYYDGAPTLFVYKEPPRVRFWYEVISMQRGIGFEYPNSSRAKSIKSS